MRLLFVCALAACSSNQNGSGFTGEDAGVLAPSDAGFGTNSDAKTGVPEEVFGHSGKTLYRLNPTTKAVTKVADFSGCESDVTDIAVNESGAMFGTSTTALYAIDKNSAACRLIASGTYPNSLSFLPKGTLDANAEALVGFETDDYIRIDTSTGKITTIKTRALKTGLESSGDIVSVKGGPTYLTVKAAAGASGTRCKAEDCLVELDPKTGQIIADYSEIGYSKVFGLAFWAGGIYGFTLAGTLVEIRVSGTNLITKRIDIPNAPAGLQFYGAGSSTSAPVGPS
jgi:hypothetical protein